MDQGKTNLILRVAKMYYELNMGQQEISEVENISKSTVSRLLKNAMELGFVEVKIKPPIYSTGDLEDQITKRFGLKKSVLVQDVIGSEEILTRDVCSVLGEDLHRYIPNPGIIGVAWGRTLNVLIKLLPKIHGENTKVIQLNGGSSKALYESGASEVVKAFRNALGGEGFLLPVPAVMDNKGLVALIKEDSQVKSVLQMVDQCNTAIFSVGDVSKDAVLYEMGCFSKEEYEGIERSGAVGDVCSHFINNQGEIADEEIDGRVVGASLEQIKKIPTKILVVAGKKKARAILGCLRGGLVDVLYIDEQTAKLVLEMD
ncbi:MAG: sugar-binding transcriptional regulator [Eubacteriaceae bacterium]